MSGLLKYYVFKKWVYHNSSSSTNEDLTNYVSKSSPSTNILLYTYKQTDGKGQIGRKWYSGAHMNLTLSLFIPIKALIASQQFQLNMLISLSMADWLDSLVPDHVYLKWPNDLFYQKKKLAGLLIQNTIQASNITKSIIGFGLNVNENNFPLDIPRPISLLQATGSNYSLVELVGSLALFLHKSLHYYDRMTFAALKLAYVQRLYGRNEDMRFRDMKQDILFKGKIIGVTDEGRLEMIVDNTIKTFNFREITYLD